METLRWQVGDATILRIWEVDASAALQGLIPKFDPAAVSRAAWLTPDFVDEMGRPKGLVQAFLIMIAGQTIIVDPGVGNGKRRTAVPGWNDMHTDFLDRLLGTGVEPDEVDFVVNTHLHFDHVGWHTRLVDGAWQPTFPAARYVISAEEFRYWQSAPENQIADQHAGFSDSVLPVYQAGLVDLVADDHVVTDGVRLVPTPGHTPHHVSVMIESRGQSAVITGDVMHHPCQIAYPDWGASDFDGSQAQASRSHLIERFADSDTLIIGSHFADPVAGRIRSEGATFRLVPAEG
ncbi:MAG TPA: MBL fold metallo-hydrolase [Propionibacteriaceae bacterium]|nr:MBL fold metallo-hydrolase [Propionibacteriaceae bacterium]